MPFYDFFVKLKNLGFRAFFRPYGKGMSSRLVLMTSHGQYKYPLIFPHRFENINADLVLHNYDLIGI